MKFKATFDNPDEVIGPLKNYLASGRYNRSGFADISNDCSLVMLANIELDENTARNEDNLIAALPKVFHGNSIIRPFCWYNSRLENSQVSKRNGSFSVGLKWIFGEALLSLAR